MRGGTAPAQMRLLPAEHLLALASEDTGLGCYPLSPDDALLMGARAVLIRDHDSIYYAAPDSDRMARLQRFSQAHEFAHHWLHDSQRDEFTTDEDQLVLLLIPSLTQAMQVAEGYSPAERRETEANTFAAEFLLPAPLLRYAFLEQNLNALQIAELVGVTESCVLSQLAQALLLPAAHEPPVTIDGNTALVRKPVSAAEGLDADQTEAALLESGPALIDAGPGTGKTRTLVARACHLLTERNLPPERLLALTFSNKAAEEMRTRLREQVGKRAEQVWIGTFHAFGFELLRKDGQRIGLPNQPQLLQTSDAVELLNTHLDRLHLHELEYLHDPTLPFPDILRCISRAKDECVTPEGYRELAERQWNNAADEEARIKAVRSREVAQVYAVYEALQRERGLLDYGDLLMRSVELLDTCPEVRLRWQQQFAHVLADEYQDVNRACAFLLQRLVGAGEGFWAVGDLRQAIYRFRGASPANVREFDRDFPGGKRLRLGTNYRSDVAIVSLFSGFAVAMSQEMAEANAPAERLTLWKPQRGEAALTPLMRADADDEDAQADGMAAQIRHFQETGIALEEQAILVCTNAQAADLAEGLERRGIATQHLGSLFERSEVKDMLALTALTCEPHGATLRRVAQFPEYAIPPEDVTLLLEEAKERRHPFPQALSLAESLPGLAAEGRAGMRRLWAHLKPIVRKRDVWTLLARYLFETSGYLRPLLAAGTVEAVQRMLALSQLLTFAQGLTERLQPREDETQPQLFLRHLRQLILCGEERSARTPGGVEGLPAVRLMTVHQSKGLEFPVVYLPNLNKGQFPARGSSGMVSPPPELLGDDADEAKADGADCLFFVALSRARNHLVLSRPLRRGDSATAPSSLLERLNPALTACDAARIEWPRLLPDAPSAAPVPELATSPQLSLWEVDTYRDCPRRYFYQQVAKLPRPEETSAYLHFHSSLKETMQWVRAERASGRTPSQDDAESQLRSVWAQQFGGEESAQSRLLHAHAETMLANAFHDLSGAANETPNLRLVARLEHGEVEVAVDAAETLSDGGLRVVRHLRRRIKKTDHTDERLALIRHAAEQSDPTRPVRLELVSLATRETKEVKPSLRYEPARVEKYNAALHGIRAGHFPPEPEERKCALCPFFFLCPA